MSIDHMGQVRKGMEVRTSDDHKLGKITEIWLGTDPTPSHPRCDEDVCSRIEVHHGFLGGKVLYIPYNAIEDVSTGRVALNVTHSMVNEHDWIKQPGWIANADGRLEPDKGTKRMGSD